jgi:hypothetical protein
LKIRADFVTNSSSVSYILTVHPDVSDIMLRAHGHKDRSTAFTQLLAFARDKIMSEGTPVHVGGDTLYALPVKFQTDGDGELLETYGITHQNVFTDALPTGLPDDKMLALLYGVLIFSDEATVLHQLGGFGATQTDTF